MERAVIPEPNWMKAPRFDWEPFSLNVARNYTRAPKIESIQLVKRCKQKNNRISTTSTGGHKHPAARNAAQIAANLGE